MGFATDGMGCDLPTTTLFCNTAMMRTGQTPLNTRRRKPVAVVEKVAQVGDYAVPGAAYQYTSNTTHTWKRGGGRQVRIAT
jgi:hypothetical protein